MAGAVSGGSTYVLLMIIFFTRHGAYSITNQSCEVGAQGSCISPQTVQVCTTPNGSLPVGSLLYQTDAVWMGMRAMDICFVVSATPSMQSSVWLQLLVPVIEDELLKHSVGVNGTANRYCLAMFTGSGSYAMTSYMMVNNQVFFPSSQFPSARRQLPRDRDAGDGYEGVGHVARTAPFRSDKFIGRSIILITDTGRNTTFKSNTTWEGMYQTLVGNQVLFDAIISSQLYINGSSGLTVLGSNGTQRAFVLQPNGGYLSTAGQVAFNNTQGTTLQDYVTLAMAVGGSAWSIGLIGREDVLVMRSFAAACLSSHSIGPVQSQRLCLQCTCMVGGVTSCIPHSNQSLCLCLMGNTLSQCGLSPSSTTTMATSLLQSTPSAIPRAAPEIIGTTLQTPSGNLQVTFNCSCAYDNQCSCSGVQYVCILLDATTTQPMRVQCNSPYVVGGLPEGHYSLLVEASIGTTTALKVFKFDLGNNSLPALQITASQSLPDIGGNTVVQFSVNRAKAKFFCSLVGGVMKPCVSPYLVGRETLGYFLIVAVDSLDQMSSTILTIDRPTTTPPTTPGPVTIVTNVGIPDARGVLKITFVTSRQDCICTCSVDVSSPMSCSGSFLADPRSLGAGSHTLVIACQAEDGTSTSINLRFNLNQPPPLPSGPFSCNLDFNTTELGDRVTANFTCNRPFIATCQVSNLPTEICKSPYILSTQVLLPGNQIFILVTEDGYGESLMKIYPFTVSSALRKCCPTILRNSLSLNTTVSLTAQLGMEIGAGNCTQQDGFSYMVTWGDGASDTGSRAHVGTVTTYRRYSYPGMYTIQMAVCNNPVNTIDLCCDNLLWPIEVILKT